MPSDQDRNEEYQPQYLYIEDYPPEKPKKRKCEEDDDHEERGIIIIEIL